MSKYRFFTSNEIKPGGWLLRQLKIQAEGLSGNLDKIWPDVRDSAWIGGNREGWERVPYWLDGFVPLAYLLDDADMIARAKKYIDAILEGQKESGWICPCTEEQIPEYDTWAVQLISKVLVVYYECSGDERIPDVLRRAMKNYYDLLSSGKISLFGWGQFRWFETFFALNFLYRRSPEPWIPELAEILSSQGFDYASVTDRWVRPMNQWTFETHVVNLAMMIKTEAVTADLLPGKYSGQAEKLLSALMKYNGTPAGIFTGDECLSGLSPIQGTELCSVAELMFSLENLYAVTGDPAWAERLEKAAFNALPATISDDMWTHQYVQMSNQISCERFPGRSLFRTNNSEAHLFGLEPHYGCCTANFNQAWPKLALSAFMRADGGIVASLPVPSELNADGISITLKTDYPFINRLSYSVKPGRAFRFSIRVPSFAKALTVNGKETDNTGVLVFDIAENEGKEIEVAFDCDAGFIERPHGLSTVVCGSLVFSLPIRYEKKMTEYEKNGVERKFPYCDYEYVCASEWRYGFAGKKLTVCRGEVNDVPFASFAPAVTVRAEAAPIDWDYEDGFVTVAAKVPADRKAKAEKQEVTLYPYGCAKLRLTELPFCEE